MSQIVIKLDDYDSVARIEPTNLVHRQIYENLRRDIAESLGKARERIHADAARQTADAERYPPGSGLIHFIDGSRGAGKTTFLRSMYANLPGALSSGQGAADAVRIKQLDYIDPTRLEGSEIVLLNVLRALKQVAHTAQLDTRNEALRDDFRRQFKVLARGLSLFRKGHDQLAHHDPELFFDRGLARADDSNSLRNNLHAAIDTACKMLGVDALLLAFDDADTNSRHAYRLLECFRNYLDTPRLVILVTGDMELYSLLTRREFSLQLPTAAHDPGEGRDSQRIRMLDHLEDQYLLKLFPLRRRYHLKKLGRLLEEADTDTDYAVQVTGWGGATRSPKSVLNEIIRRGLRIRTQPDVDLFREHLLKQPLRSILQVLQRCASLLCESDDRGNVDSRWNRNLSDAVRESFRAMAQGSLYKKGIMVDDLAANYLPTLTKAVFELACEDGDVDTAAYLRPQASDDDLNNCYLSLAAEVAGLCANSPTTALTYMMSGPGSVSLWGKEMRRVGGKVSPELLQRQFRQYMAIGRADDALNWARRATAVFAAPHFSKTRNAVIDFGIIGLTKRRPREAPADSAGETIESILHLATDHRSALPAFAYSLLDVSSQHNRCYASIYNILGLIERLWKADRTEIARRLSSTFPQLSISSPDWGDTADSAIDNDAEDDDLDDNSRDELKPASKAFRRPALKTQDPLEQLVDAIVTWQKLHKNRFNAYAPSSILLGKIWVRIYFSLEKSSDRSRTSGAGKKKTADEVMAISAACIINAFLVEEADHGLGGYEGALDRTNPLSSLEKYLASKREFLADNRENLPLTYAIASCPLILGLLSEGAINIVTSALGLSNTHKLPSATLVKRAFIVGRTKKPSSSPNKKTVARKMLAPIVSGTPFK
ncbi:hypothetical protein F3J16_18140 [Burkholderia sp. Ap-962]|uniref:hypothetical protein n=1 Tax=Burkholderia sp. Ap-962 TaxID=2608333 RepID=UPI00141F4E83|nr:hypothetical protein [Burkholderia sp. Ap-962]NIF72093.1 hypothetical protein [Burkholderia sp. Ap-962]